MTPESCSLTVSEFIQRLACQTGVQYKISPHLYFQSCQRTAVMGIKRNLCPIGQSRLQSVHLREILPQETFVTDETRYSIYQSLVTLHIPISQIHGID